MELLQQIKDFLIPKLDAIRLEQGAIRDRLNSIDMHLVDQSRRIDETNKRIDAVHADLLRRIDETNKRIDAVHADLLRRIDETNKRIDETNKRIDETNRRLDRLYEVVVRRDEHDGLNRWVQSWSQEIERRLDALERKVA